MTAKKDDARKLRMDLVPHESQRLIAEVFTFGAGKYGDRNWEQGIDASRLYAAAQRHLLSWREGELLDSESGLPHLAHACVNLTMLMVFEYQEGLYDCRKIPHE